MVSATPIAKAVRVRSGDSLWKLARHNLGHGNRWPELLAANPAIADPNRLPIGAELLLPNLPSYPVPSTRPNPTPRQASRITPSAILQIRHGDTLWSLARQHLGDPAAWPCLAAANPSISDPNRIFAGQELILPTACRQSRLAASHSALK
jgi:nucleoid-associated protein YgaU